MALGANACPAVPDRHANPARCYRRDAAGVFDQRYGVAALAAVAPLVRTF